MAQKLPIHKQASIYSQQYAQLLGVQMQQAVMEKQAKISKGEFEFSSWDTFWQLYNRLFNAGRYREVLFHILLNYNPKWNVGKR